MMDETNPYASPAHASEAGLDRVPLSPTVGVWGILGTSLSIYVRHFPAILAVVLMVWTPLELLTSYMSYFVFEPEDLRRVLQLSLLLDALVGIVATGAVISIAAAAVAGEEVRFFAVFVRGLAAWPRLLSTRLLSGLAIGLGFVACVAPGIYLAVRLALVDSVAVQERAHGPAAMRRSFELTNQRFGKILLLLLATVGVIMVPSVVFYLPMEFVPMMDHWLVDAAFTLVIDVIAAFMTVSFYVAYAALASAHNPRPIE